MTKDLVPDPTVCPPPPQFGKQPVRKLAMVRLDDDQQGVMEAWDKVPFNKNKWEDNQKEK